MTTRSTSKIKTRTLARQRRRLGLTMDAVRYRVLQELRDNLEQHAGEHEWGEEILPSVGRMHRWFTEGGKAPIAPVRSALAAALDIDEDELFSGIR